MSNSALATVTRLSPNCSPRTAKIDTITIHHMAGNLSVEVCGAGFANPDRKASSNYGVGADGRIGLYVPEDKRAWTSSNWRNDDRAVTIEVANDGKAPDWHVSDTALEATIALCVDICRRNDIPRLNYTGDASGNLTMHKWFSATLCPGPYLESKFGYIADEVNRRLGAPVEEPQPDPNPKEPVTPVPDGKYRVQVGAYESRNWAENQLAALRGAGFPDAFLAEVDGTLWRLQVGPFASKADAEARLVDLKAAGYTGYVTTQGGAVAPAPTPDPEPEAPEGKYRYWLQVGPYEKLADAEAIHQELLGAGYPAVLVAGDAAPEPEPDPKPEPDKSLERIAQEVVWGLWGNGAERKQRLEAAGYDYGEVQGLVDKLMGRK